MFALLGLIPGLLSTVTAYLQRRTDAQVEMTKAKIGGDTEKARELVKLQAVAEHEQTAKLAVVAGNRILTILVCVFAAPLAVYFNKVIVYDIVLGLGSTPALRDPQIIAWSQTIIAFVFGAPTALALGKMIMGR